MVHRGTKRVQTAGILEIRVQLWVEPGKWTPKKKSGSPKHFVLVRSCFALSHADPHTNPNISTQADISGFIDTAPNEIFFYFMVR